MSIKKANFKVIVFGESNVGKATFSDNYLASVVHVAPMNIGVEFKTKEFLFDNYHIKLEFWIFGEEKHFRCLHPQYCKNADAAIIFYDITQMLRLDNLREWIQIIWANAGDIPIALVGTKMDLEKARVTSREEGIRAAEKYNLALFAEISTKTGKNIEELFVALMKLLFEKESEVTHKKKVIYPL